MQHEFSSLYVCSPFPLPSLFEMTQIDTAQSTEGKRGGVKVKVGRAKISFPVSLPFERRRNIPYIHTVLRHGTKYIQDWFLGPC